jgi:arylsulfatase A-like enzyme
MRVEDLPAILNRAGYRTLLFGHQHERDNPAEFTYSESWTETAGGEQVAARVAQFLKGEASRRQPFFLSAGFNDVHRRFGDEYDPQLADRLTVPGFLPEAPIVRKDLATFYERIRHADAAVGVILDALRDADLARNTLIYFTTDHGPEFPRAKMTLYDPGLKVALLMRLPGVIPAGARVRELTSHVDLLPTLLAQTGIAGTEARPGRALLPPARQPARDAVFAALTWHGGEYDPMRCIRTERYKYIRNWQPGWPILLGGPYVERYGAEFIERHFAQPRPAEELYDLAADPWEQRNLAADPATPSVRADLGRRLQEWMESVDDPLLRGPVPAADPARVGYDCVWGRFRSHTPEREPLRFRVLLTRSFGENPL